MLIDREATYNKLCEEYPLLQKDYLRRVIDEVPTAEVKGDLIRREDAIDAIYKCTTMGKELKQYVETHNDHYAEGVLEALEAVEDLPSAEHKGHWILSEYQNQEDVENGNYWYICSECSHFDLHAKTQEVPFCWWCGARMVSE